MESLQEHERSPALHFGSSCVFHTARSLWIVSAQQSDSERNHEESRIRAVEVS